MKSETLKRLRERKASVSVIGIGYVGLPLAREFARVGFAVCGVDKDEGRVRSVNEGVSYISDVPSEEMAPLVASGKLRASTDFDVLDGSDAVLICVPTPLSKTRDPDMSFILDACDEVKRHLKRGQLISLESTTYPGTTAELVAPMFGSTGLRPDEDFFLAFSPERINPGDPVYGVVNTPKVVGGIGPNSTEVVKVLYEQVIERVVPVSTSQVAELTKLLENTFRSVNIALVNELAIMCRLLGVDVWEVLDAAASKPFGFMKFTPGPGIGGHCIPIDPHYLSWKLKTLNYNSRMIEVASEINTGMPRYVVSIVSDALNEESKALKGSRVLVVGVAYKADIDDVRESPALDILSLLASKGAVVSYSDPLVPEIRLNGDRLESVPLTDENLSAADCVLVATDHSSVPWDRVFSASRLVVDTKNVRPGVSGCRVVRL